MISGVEATASIAAEIAQVGPIPFERYMELALYGPHGFYTGPAGGSAGRRGDFLTSPEVGPLFGAVMARRVDAEWHRLGEPSSFTLVEVAAGPGTLARSILAAQPECAAALHYVGVEVSSEQRAKHPAEIESAADMPTEPIDGMVICNELLDNLPFRLAVYDDGWREAYVDVESVDGVDRLVEILSAPFDPQPARLPDRAALGARVPLIDRAAAFVDDARGRLATGSLFVVDYGVSLTAELAQRTWTDWLRTYRDNRRGGHYLAAPGRQDITTDVPIDQIPEPDSVRSQAQFLQLFGIDELVEEGKRIWAEEASRPGLHAMKMRSRVSEAEALLDHDGLGGFLVCEWRA